MQDIFGGNSLGPNATFCECDVFGNALGKVMASHNHIEMFVNRVTRIRHRGVGATG